MGKNCRFFADLGLKQILSGYYDTDDTGEAIVQWQAAVREVPGIIGAMYTTWEDKYEAMETWASKAWGGGKDLDSARPTSARISYGRLRIESGRRLAASRTRR